MVLTARDIDKLGEVEKELRSAYPDTKFLAIKTDVKSESDVKAAFAKAVESFGAVDVAIHNAGLNHDHAPITKSELNSWWEHYVSSLQSYNSVHYDFRDPTFQAPGH